MEDKFTDDMNDKKINFENGDKETTTLELSKSFNKGMRYYKLLLNSIRKFGLCRSVVVDKNNIVLCGHKVVNASKDCDINKVRVVETNGDELIIVKRTDMDISSAKTKEMMLVDNLITSKNLEWNTDYIIQTMDENFSFNPQDWHGYECITKELNIEDFLKNEVVRQSSLMKKEKKIEIKEQDRTLFDYE